MTTADYIATLRAEQTRRLWECIEVAVAAGCEVRMKAGAVFVIKPDQTGVEVFRESLRDGAAHALCAVVMDIQAAEQERRELVAGLDADERAVP